MKHDSKLFSGLKFIYICRKPSHIGIMLRHLGRGGADIRSDRIHLRAVMDWLCKAQDATGCGGVSAGYNLARGWKPPFPETTGYIIRTFVQCSSALQDDSYLDRAIRMGDWEIEIQLPSGAVRGGVGINEYPVIFETGQVILGWISLYEETNRDEYLQAASRAADWLVGIQDDDGKWSQHAFEGVPHAYHSRVAWSLLEVYRCTGEEKYKHAARKNVLWTLSLAGENGWFRQAGFTTDEVPLAHTIAYTLRGLLESSSYLEDEQRESIGRIVRTASENIIERHGLSEDEASCESRAFLPAFLNDRWTSDVSFTCPVGNIQLAIIWLKLHESRHEVRYSKAALRLIDQVKGMQSLNSRNPGIRGGIPGSYPIGGGYITYGYPNWAAKFFADALMLKTKIGQPPGDEG
ncbi:beta-L-arabinofuranosidase domain-containing protein [Candidatus Zixiibacteriota bacterium]